MSRARGASPWRRRARRAAAVSSTSPLWEPTLGSPARYARTKAAGETAIREVLPEAAVVRPSVIFGPGDHFFNRFASMAVLSPALPLIGGGSSLFQPVFVGDVAAALAACLASPATEGRTFELGGPSIYSFRELMEILLAEIGRARLLLPIPFGLAGMIALTGDGMAAAGLNPPLTSDQLTLLRADNVVSRGAMGLAELGLSPSALEPIIPTYLYRYRKGGQYANLALGAAR